MRYKRFHLFFDRFTVSHNILRLSMNIGFRYGCLPAGVIFTIAIWRLAIQFGVEVY